MMEHEMMVKKHITEESSEKNVYKVQLKATLTTSPHIIKGCTITSADPQVFEEFPKDRRVQLEISTPQTTLGTATTQIRKAGQEE